MVSVSTSRVTEKKGPGSGKDTTPGHLRTIRTVADRTLCICSESVESTVFSFSCSVFFILPMTARRSNQSILKEISPGCSLEGLMLKLKLQYFGHLMQSWLIGKDSDAGRDREQEEKGATEDEMAGWHHWLDGHGFGWSPGVGDGQGGLACCNSWGSKASDTTERLNWTELMISASASKQSLLCDPQFLILASRGENIKNHTPNCPSFS